MWREEVVMMFQDVEVFLLINHWFGLFDNISE